MFKRSEKIGFTARFSDRCGGGVAALPQQATAGKVANDVDHVGELCVIVGRQERQMKAQASISRICLWQGATPLCKGITLISACSAAMRPSAAPAPRSTGATQYLQFEALHVELEVDAAFALRQRVLGQRVSQGLDPHRQLAFDGADARQTIAGGIAGCQQRAQLDAVRDMQCGFVGGLARRGVDDHPLRITGRGTAQFLGQLGYCFERDQRVVAAHTLADQPHVQAAVSANIDHWLDSEQAYQPAQVPSLLRIAQLHPAPGRAAIQAPAQATQHAATASRVDGCAIHALAFRGSKAGVGSIFADIPLAPAVAPKANHSQT